MDTRFRAVHGGVDVIGQHTGDLLVEIEHVGD